MSWRSSLPIRGIGGCGIEALSNLAPHLEPLHMLALWGRLWSRLGFRFRVASSSCHPPTLHALHLRPAGNTLLHHSLIHSESESGRLGLWLAGHADLAGLASGFGMVLGFLFLGTKLSSTISLVK